MDNRERETHTHTHRQLEGQLGTDVEELRTVMGIICMAGIADAEFQPLVSEMGTFCHHV